MKKCLSFLLLLPVFVFSQDYFKKKRVLFLGNSYTYVNNLPSLIANLALGNGDTLVYDSNCPGGYTFNNHFSDAISLSKIALGNWDYVVLQAQSQEPSFSPTQVNAQTLPFALKLDSVVKKHNPCATSVFYETWGRKNGDALNCGSYPPVCTYLGMQNRLLHSYKLFADSTKGVMAPCGEVFRSSISFSPSLNLYQPDESHPSLEGSYLAAAVFYEVLFQRSVLSNTFNPGIGSNHLSFLQQQAHSVLRDSLHVWNIGKHLSWADFKVDSSNNPFFQFSTQSPTLSNKWFFGDGSISVQNDPQHTYLLSGTYTVSHVVSKGCSRDSLSKIITVLNTTGFGKRVVDETCLLYPNPCRNQLKVRAELRAFDNKRVRIMDANGRLLIETELKDQINVSELKSGMYFFELTAELDAIRVPFIKE